MAFTPFLIKKLEIEMRAIESSTGKKAKGSFVVGTELFKSNYKIRHFIHNKKNIYIFSDLIAIMKVQDCLLFQV